MIKISLYLVQSQKFKRGDRGERNEVQSTEWQSPPQAYRGGRFDLSLLKKEEGQNEHSAEKQPDAHSR